MSSVPKTAVAAITVVIVATMVRSLLGVSLAAGVLISFIAVVWWGSAITGTAKSMRIFSIGLAIYGGAFVAQAIFLPQYVGSRLVDAVWGGVLVAAGVFFYAREVAPEI